MHGRKEMDQQEEKTRYKEEEINIGVWRAGCQQQDRKG